MSQGMTAKQVTGWGGTTMNGGLARRSFTAVMFITKIICLWVQGRAYIWNRKQGNISRERARTLWGHTFVGECMQACGCMRQDRVT